MTIFEEMESNVRSYCRSFPVVFDRACGYNVFDTAGRSYLDFLCGAGALNYGHNPRVIVEAVVDYLQRNGITTSLDLHTVSKQQFLERFRDVVLRPRNMDYVVQFTGPTGTNAVEAALKLARMLTKRTNVVAFTNSYHGATLGALAATGKRSMREAAGLPLSGITHFPYDGYHESAGPELLNKMLSDGSSGIDLPAAIIVEVVQGEGGLAVASARWLQRLQTIARKHGAMLIIDDVQAGCGRTGTFFSFEGMGIDPDVVCLSKSISGIGLPMALVLIRRPLDQWGAGQHNGTFRGNNLAFVAGRVALEHYWADSSFVNSLGRSTVLFEKLLLDVVGAEERVSCQLRGRGFMRGLAFGSASAAQAFSQESFELGLIAEVSGPSGEVVKLLPPITIDEAGLSMGAAVLNKALRRVGDGTRTPRREALAAGKDR